MSDFDQGYPKAHDLKACVADASGKLERGREAYRRRAWGEAYQLLSLADRATPLGAEDVELLAIAVPTTLIWGRHDLATRLPIAEAASARYGWPLQVIENAADDPPMEQPEAFVKALYAAL